MGILGQFLIDFYSYIFDISTKESTTIKPEESINIQMEESTNNQYKE